MNFCKVLMHYCKLKRPRFINIMYSFLMLSHLKPKALYVLWLVLVPFQVEPKSKVQFQLSGMSSSTSKGQLVS